MEDDESKFDFDKKDWLGIIDGSLLWIDIEEYEDKNAKITGTSWFKNISSVSVEYDPTFKNGKWNLTMVSKSIS